MKRYIQLVLFLVLMLSPYLVYAAEDFVIEDFRTTLAIQSDGTVHVSEALDVFFFEERHGIFRDLPFVYQTSDGVKTYTEISVIGVSDGERSVPHQVTTNASNMRIRIGDADKYVTGAQAYVIDYIATGVLLGYEGYDELYWNATGDEWQTDIKKSSATVTLPSGSIVQSDCFVGKRGSQERCTIGTTTDTRIEFFTGRSLSGGEGLTVAVGFKKGTVPLIKLSAPATLQDVLLNQNTLMAFGITLVAGLFFVIRRWWTHGRDSYYSRSSLHDQSQMEVPMAPNAQETIVAEYEPPFKLRPAEVGVVMDERADTVDVSATIVDLAIRGYLTIKEIPRKWLFGTIDYELTRAKKNEGDLMQYEKKLLTNLFEDGKIVKLSDLKDKFYKHLRTVKTELYHEVTNKSLFEGNPEKVRNRYIMFAIGVVVLGGALTAISVINMIGILFGIGMALDLVGIVFLIFASFMSKRTAHGREAYRLSRGYELFVSGTEKYRQPYFEDQNIFMTVLPYAMVFGVTKKLANAMKEMGIQPSTPNWYVGAHVFNMAQFTSSIDTFSSSLSTAIASTPGGSGSGGSGGGGGGFSGGGGGSW